MMTRFEETTHLAIQEIAKSIQRIEKNNLSLRDSFALEAMKIFVEKEISPDLEIVSKISYKLADAMLKVREQKGE